ncbi:PglD-related sugar-binding protein [Spirosoma daeguense]
MKKLIICGTGSHAELVHAYFEKDSNYDVTAFTVEKQYLTKTQLLGLPVFPFEEVEEYISPDEADMFIAIGPYKLNNILENFCERAKAKNYQLATYYTRGSNNFFVPDFGENCFIDHVSQFHPYVKVGKGVTMLGSQIGHHSTIGDYTFISTSIIGGNVVIEDHVFIGIGSIIKSNVRIGKGSFIGMGCTINKDVEPYSVYSETGTPERKGLDSRRINFF